ncbi:MAG: hypothetical protein CL587_19505 [Alteromonadaceae bacterium]|nr:hypothetical protein [Alteromonadaceae bacterium]
MLNRVISYLLIQTRNAYGLVIFLSFSTGRQIKKITVNSDKSICTTDCKKLTAGKSNSVLFNILFSDFPELSRNVY